MTARRVGLTPTPRSVSSASGWIAPATSQNAAAETSPGTRSLTALHRRPSFETDRHPAIASPAVLRQDVDAPRSQHPLCVVTGGHRLAYRRPSLRP